MEKFSDWKRNKIFVGVDELLLRDSRTYEKMKTLLSQEWGDVRAMHSDRVMHDICCNFMFCTNHKDGLRKSRSDRRFAVFYTAQQTEDDVKRDFPAGYFSQMSNWLTREDGYGIVADFLWDYKIEDEYNPVYLERAPYTSSLDEAVAIGLGSVEQEILEYVGQDRPCFKNGWISSMGLDALLKDLNLSRMLPPNKRRGILQAIDYDWHPHLPEGRVNRIIKPDLGKPRLFIKKGHPDASITDPAQIAKAYEKAQDS